MNSNSMHDYFVLALWIGASFAAAALGAVASRNARQFYASLDQPSWSPPGWVFAPVWTVLFTLMGISAWLVWKEGGWSSASPALSIFCVQLVFNALWSWLFFAWHRGGLAFAEVLLLWVLVACTIVAFNAHRPLAALLLVPYLLWVSFASVLTWAMWRRNPTRL